jgi:hypothetical protein
MPDNTNSGMSGSGSMSSSNSGTGSIGGSTSGSGSMSSMSSGSSSSGAGGIQGILSKLGIDENLINGMIDNWRSQLTQSLTTAIQETDLRDAFDKVRLVSGGSADVVKNYSQRNPKLFYSGVTAVLIGSALIAAAAREAAADVEGSVTTGGTTESI